MKYNFYQNKELNINSIDDSYGIKNPYELYDKLSLVWSKETCAKRMQDLWTKENKTKGQCSITAFLAQDIFGGEVYGILLSDGNYHCFNKVSDFVFDLTSEQFSYKLDYSKSCIQDRNVHFSKKEKEARYILLKNKLMELNK